MNNPIAWLDARVHALRDVTPTVREITLLAPADSAASQAAAPGSHLQVQILLGQGAMGRAHTRSYSLIDDGSPVPAAPGQAFWRIAVKRLDDGRGGSRAMWRLAVGDRLRVTPPQNHFPLDLAAPAYLLVAGGIGVTPLLGMARQLAARGAKVRMLYAARSVAELAYLAPLRAALGDGLVALPADGDGRLDLAAAMAALPAAAQCYVCGPAPLLAAARQAWAGAGRAAMALRYETFGSSGRLPPQAFRVEVPRHGLAFEVGADESLLDALEQRGVLALSDCRRGECGLCALPVLALQGEIDHRDVFLGDAEKAANQRLCACVSRVVGSITLDTAFRPDAARIAPSPSSSV